MTSDCISHFSGVPYEIAAGPTGSFPRYLARIDVSSTKVTLSGLNQAGEVKIYTPDCFAGDKILKDSKSVNAPGGTVTFAWGAASGIPYDICFEQPGFANPSFSAKVDNTLTRIMLFNIIDSSTWDVVICTPDCASSGKVIRASTKIPLFGGGGWDTLFWGVNSSI